MRSARPVGSIRTTEPDPLMREDGACKHGDREPSVFPSCRRHLNSILSPEKDTTRSFYPDFFRVNVCSGDATAITPHLLSCPCDTSQHQGEKGFSPMSPHLSQKHSFTAGFLV